jgi:SPP1 gp7 family putative phage head morphogenesis protein
VENGLIHKANDDEDPEDLLYPSLDPLDDDDFLIIIRRLAEDLSSKTQRRDAQAVRDSLDLLDVAWAALTVAAVDRLISAVRAVLVGSVDKVIPRTSPIFEAAARAVIPATRASVIEREKLDLDSRLTEADRVTGQSLLRQQGLFIRDEYGRRSDTAVARIRAIVHAGVERGLSQEEISFQLANDLTLSQLGRARAYWDVIGTSFANRARTTTQLTAYEQAGVQSYRFVAVIDDRTTDICRYLDKRIFRVAPVLARLRRAEQMDDADAIRDMLPFVHRKTVNGRTGAYFERRGVSHLVAGLDKNGEFTDGMTDSQLEAAGVAVPPLHVRCRSKIERES